ncbi:MAG: PTS sugar transporter subunit IIA [Planctomycetes bacterium]|nr:PTS sugar transporter subunit IIA [Planctomycetota bacterium]
MADEDFDLASLAEYLHVTPAQVEKLASRGKLPGRKVSGEWRFSRPEIHHWLEDRIGLSDEEELIEVESVLTRSQDAEHAVSISQMLPVAAIAAPLESARSRGKVIDAMTRLAADTALLWDPEKMADAVRQRESLHPTALDNGVALLHPRRPMQAILAEPLVALGRTSHGVPFGGRQLTDVFFLICSTDDAVHLRTLARLSRLVGDNELLAAIRGSYDPAEIHRLIAAAEQNLVAR